MSMRIRKTTLSTPVRLGDFLSGGAPAGTLLWIPGAMGAMDRPVLMGDVDRMGGNAGVTSLSDDCLVTAVAVIDLDALEFVDNTGDEITRPVRGKIESECEVTLRLDRARLSRAQYDVLSVMSDGTPRETSKSTHHRWLSGATCKALARRGLALKNPETSEGPATYEITSLGRAVLAKVEGTR